MIKNNENIRCLCEERITGLIRYVANQSKVILFEKEKDGKVYFIEKVPGTCLFMNNCKEYQVQAFCKGCNKWEWSGKEV